MRWGSARWTDQREYSYRDSVPSADEGVEFTVVLTVQARVARRRGQSPPDPLDLVVPAADAIIRPMAAGTAALRAGYLQHTVASQVADLKSLSDKQARISDVFVWISLDDDAAARAREVQRLLHELRLDELARRQARARARFVRDECLADPATARIYALLEKSPRTGELGDVLAREDLVTQVAQWHEPAKAVLVTRGIIGLFERLTPEQAVDIVSRFIPVLKAYGAVELADELQGINTPPTT
ncbi:hypothetical protein [Lentzea sp. CA-135723]|uniref:hypothetical protein n=1 Tax=Lentzea sp. CA-135723 TaxID=3239950 RepID=UPI003D8B9D9B